MLKLRSMLWNALVTFRRFMGLFALTIDRDAVAATYLAGDGIEIGALHNPLKVSEKARVKYLDRMTVADLRRQYPELEGEALVDVDIVDNGEHLATVADESQDFIIANHFVEHSQNPLLSIANMFRVLRVGGILYMALPDKRYSFDAERPVTSLEHLQRDFDEGPEWSKKGHFEEWARFIDKAGSPDKLERQVNRLMAMDYSIHFHVWGQKEMVEMVMFLRDLHSFEIEVMLKSGKEQIFVLRKTPALVDSGC